MENKDEYNGWTNYETWNVKLWMDNDEGSYSFWQEEAQRAYDNAEAEKSFTRQERAALDLSAQIKDQHEENTPTTSGCYADLLNAALSQVNW